MSTSRGDRPGLRQFWAGLRPEGRWLLSTVAVQTLGRGLTLPFTIIYLHEVRGISLDLAGALMAFIAVVALVVTGPGGALTDRIGARRMLLCSTTAQLVGCVSWPSPPPRRPSRSRSRCSASTSASRGRRSTPSSRP